MAQLATFNEVPDKVFKALGLELATSLALRSSLLPTK
jgi:hypothetical protein